MHYARISALAVPLTAAEQDQVYRAAEAAGKDVDDFMRDAVLAAADDPFLAALDRAADTVAARSDADRVQHDYATD
ncbi:hypothetical protein [Streptomyces sp. CL12-4]|uniref:hypothetical protein n=1 Tax=Streptomyces sp. CL12-4 TaxID=2810306 RepID=UPI001EFB8397|nr:hypothetical protein [Streptomyces sp. CL12-4]MCG8971802.1 hypothetical protein [Streptomyces sp. CL12-4]